MPKPPAAVDVTDLKAADQARARARFEAARAALPDGEPFLDFIGTVGEFRNDDTNWFLVRVPFNYRAQVGRPGNVRAFMCIDGVYLERNLFPTKLASDHAQGISHLIWLAKGLARHDGAQLHIQLFRALNPGEVDVPPELEEALDVDALARARWDWLPVGIRRGQSLWLYGTTKPETRANRAVQVFQWLMEPTASAIARKRMDWPEHLGGI